MPLFLSPLLAPYLINPGAVPLYSIPAFSLLAFIAFLLPKKTTTLPVPALLLLVLLAAIPLLLHSQALLAISALLVMLLFGAALDIQRHVAAFHTFVIATALIAVISLLAWFGWSGGEAIRIYGWALTTDVYQLKMNGPFANGNVLAIVLVCAWCICAGFWLSSKHSTQWAWLLALLFFWSCIFGTLARGAWLAHAFIILWLLAALFRRRTAAKAAVLLCTGIIAWFASGPITGLSMLKQAETPQHQLEETSTPGLNERLILWQSSWEMIKAGPLFGVGPSQFKAHYLSSQAVAMESHPSHNGLGATDSAHNILLHLLAEYGIAGGLLWLLISGLLLRLSWLYRHKTESLRWPALACALVLWIQGHVNISLTEPYPLILFAFMLGISCKPLIGDHTFAVRKSWLILCAAAICSLLIAGAIQTTRSWDQFGQWVRMDASTPEKGKLAAELARNDTLFPYIVEFSIAELAHRPEKQQQIAKMRPLILRAISLYERPRLYQELFYSYLIDQQLDEACRVGEFISKQNWKDEPNASAYTDVCNGKLPDSYHF